MAISMMASGIEMLVWNQILSFGAFQWLLGVMGQREIGIVLLLIGWLRASALLFNGQKLMGRKLGPVIRGVCAVLSASMWGQFALALILQAYTQGYPSVSLPFWTMFVVSEFYLAYTLGAEWKRS